MQEIRSPSDAACLPEGAVRELLLRRFAQLEGAEERLLASGRFLIAEPGDDLEVMEKAADWPLFHGLLDDIPAGEEGFSPSWEWLEVHHGVTEILWVLSDDGGFLTILIPDAQGIDPALQAVGAEYGRGASPNS